MPTIEPPTHESLPEPISVGPEELVKYHDLAAPLRKTLDGSDPTGQLSTMLLVAALRRMDDLFIVISSTAEEAEDLLLWDPLADLPACVRKAGGDQLPRLMLILISDLAKGFTTGFTTADTPIGALALEVILAEATFLAELWSIGITSQDIADVGDVLLFDTDHHWLYSHTRKLSKKHYRGLFQSYFEHPNGRNGLNPFVEMP
jgi:hypothetical protein